MRYHWIRDQVTLGNFTVTWEPGATNLADFFTKAHQVSHHVKMMTTYTLPKENVLISSSISLILSVTNIGYYYLG